jgi:hypothetical protein
VLCCKYFVDECDYYKFVTNYQVMSSVVCNIQQTSEKYWKYKLKLIRHKLEERDSFTCWRVLLVPCNGDGWNDVTGTVQGYVHE